MQKHAWIMGRTPDMALLVATPLLIMPLTLLAAVLWQAEQIALVIAAFGATGHHLPGMMRAYGDRELFSQYKIRFVVAPLFLLTICTLSFFFGLRGIELIVLTWGIWHGLMQTYGFARIYDAKASVSSRLGARLDFLMCFSWFAAGFIFSETRMTGFLDQFYTSGGPFVTASLISTTRMFFLVLTVSVTLAFVTHTYRQARKQAWSLLKVLLLISSFAFWWFCMFWPQNMILGIVMFEVFHDVQYLSIVWLFNRNRVEKGANVGPLTTFLFQRRNARLLLYICCVLIYGAWDYFGDFVANDTAKTVLLAVVTASTLLHFYFDGFIWKIRQRQTGEALGVETGLRRFVAPKSVAVFKWAIFVVPLFWLAYAQLESNRTELKKHEMIVESLPNSSMAQNNLGVVLQSKGDITSAQHVYQRALNLYPEYADAMANLGRTHLLNHQYADALACFRRAVDIRVLPSMFHRDFANALRLVGLNQEAETQYALTLQKNASDVETMSFRALNLIQLGKLDLAQQLLEEALARSPDHVIAHANLGSLHRTLGDHDLAVEHHQRAAELSPEPNMLMELAISHMQAGQVAQACERLERILVLDSGSIQAHRYLAALHALSNRPEEALPHLLYLAEESPDLDTRMGLANVYVELGQYPLATAQLQLVLDQEEFHRDAMQLLADIWIKEGQFQKALGTLLSYLGMQPNDVNALDQSGMLQAKLNRFVDARMAFERALQIDERFVPARVHLAQLLVHMRDWQEADSHFQMATELDANHLGAHLGRLRLAQLRGDSASIKAFAEAVLTVDRHNQQALDAMQGITSPRAN